MAVKKNLKRIMISLPKAQVTWLQNFCKEHDLTVSKYIKYLLAKKAEEMIVILNIQDRRDAWMTESDLHDLMEIIKAPWIED